MKLRSQLYRRLQLWLPSVAVFAVGSVLSVGAMRYYAQGLEQAVLERLDREASVFAATLEQRLHAYGNIVQGLRPWFQMQTGMQEDIFANSVLARQMLHRYEGVVSISYTRRLEVPDYAAYYDWLVDTYPRGQRAAEDGMPTWPLRRARYYIVDYVWPQHAGYPLVGLDAEKAPATQEQIARLQFSDALVMSAPLPLRQTQQRNMGVLISAAVRDPDGREENYTEVSGLINLAVRFDSLVEHFMGRGMLPYTAVAIRDLGPSGAKLDMGKQPVSLYQSPSWEAGSVQSSGLRLVRHADIMGRKWSMEFEPEAGVLSGMERSYPGVIGATGLVLSALLALMMAWLVRRMQWAQEQEQAKHQLLSQQTERFKALLNQSAIGIAEVNCHTGQFITVNTRFAEIVGYQAQDLQPLQLQHLLQPGDAHDYQRLSAELASGQRAHFNMRQRMQRPDGGQVWTEAWVSPLLGEEQPVCGRHIVLLLDVSSNQEMQERLLAREAYSSEMLRYMPVGLVVVGPSGEIEFVSHQFQSMTGWGLEDLPDESSMWQVLCADARQHTVLLQRLNAGRCDVVPSGVNMPAAEYLLRGKDGTEIAAEVTGRFLGGRILLTFVDLRQRKAAEEEIRWLGYYDTLTHLPNRRLLLDRLKEVLQRNPRAQVGKAALLLLDIDNFKSLNETLGHAHGDALLRLVATRLSSCIPAKHTLARQGGDEFAVVLEDLPAGALECAHQTEQVGQAVLQALRAPFYIQEQDFHVTVSMGATIFRGTNDTVEEVLKRADLALYQAKSAGRDTLQFFDPSMQRAVSARVEMEKDMRLALERHEFDLFFQPQVQKDKVIGAEALLRWKHAAKGYISPSVFVPAAEESGLILPLGTWVLYAACRQLAQWAQDPLMAALTMSVNVSPRQFYQPDFVEQVQLALQVTGASASQLELELTEGMLLTDVDDTIEKMVQLKAMGVIFSLDDFGTGYSSLSYLKRLPLDKLKIDQSFVREVLSSPNDATIARTIVALGHNLGLQVIAEGVETEAQRDFLEASGCMYWQGYLFSRPQPGEDFTQWVKAYTQAGKGVLHA